MSFLKPGFSSSMRYELGKRFTRRYSPERLVVISVRAFVLMLTTAIRAREITAFEGSVTRPLRDAFVDWPRTSITNVAEKKIARTGGRRIMQSSDGSKWP